MALTLPVRLSIVFNTACWLKDCLLALTWCLLVSALYLLATAHYILATAFCLHSAALTCSSQHFTTLLRESAPAFYRLVPLLFSAPYLLVPSFIYCDCTSLPLDYSRLLGYSIVLTSDHNTYPIQSFAYLLHYITTTIPRFTEVKIAATVLYLRTTVLYRNDCSSD